MDAFCTEVPLINIIGCGYLCMIVQFSLLSIISSGKCCTNTSSVLGGMLVNGKWLYGLWQSYYNISRWMHSLSPARPVQVFPCKLVYTV